MREWEKIPSDFDELRSAAISLLAQQRSRKAVWFEEPMEPQSGSFLLRDQISTSTIMEVNAALAAKRGNAKQTFVKTMSVSLTVVRRTVFVKSISPCVPRCAVDRISARLYEV